MKPRRLVVAAASIAATAAPSTTAEAPATTAPSTAVSSPTIRKPKARYKRVRRVHRYRRYGASYSGVATYYALGACDSGSGGGATTSAGTHVRFGEVAQSTLPLGTRIEVRPAIFGRRDFRIEDRFGSSQSPGRLDVWMTCSMGSRWSNPRETFRTYREKTIIFWKRVRVA
jgi:hypothetical protein